MESHQESQGEQFRVGDVGVRRRRKMFRRYFEVEFATLDCANKRECSQEGKASLKIFKGEAEEDENCDSNVLTAGASSRNPSLIPELTGSTAPPITNGLNEPNIDTSKHGQISKLPCSVPSASSQLDVQTRGTSFNIPKENESFPPLGSTASFAFAVSADCPSSSHLINEPVDEPTNPYRLKIPPKPVDGRIYNDVPWICCLCQRAGSCEEPGPLYGPFYMRLVLDYWPPYVADLPSRLLRKAYSFVELWFHGGCALWASALRLVDGEVKWVDRSIRKYWRQQCSVCEKHGATIRCVRQSCDVYCHYPCAIDGGYRLEEKSWTVCCAVHLFSPPGKKKLPKRRKNAE